MSGVTGSEAGTGPSLAQGSTGPPEEVVLGGTGGPQGSALGGVTATGEGEMQGRVNTTLHEYNSQKNGGNRKLGWDSLLDLRIKLKAESRVAVSPQPSDLAVLMAVA